MLLFIKIVFFYEESGKVTGAVTGKVTRKEMGINFSLLKSQYLPIWTRSKKEKIQKGPQVSVMQIDCISFSTRIRTLPTVEKGTKLHLCPFIMYFFFKLLLSCLRIFF